MFDRFQLEELNSFGTTDYTWIVDVPRSAQQKPDHYKISRKKGFPGSDHNYAHLDSPTVKQSGMRQKVESAVLARMQGAVSDIVYDKNVALFRITAKGPVQRYGSPQHKRLNSPLLPIGISQVGKDYFLDFILAQEAPVRYQVQASSAIEDHVYRDGVPVPYRSMKMFVFRRSNPRSKGTPEYRMMPMSPGRKKTASVFSTDQAISIERAFQELETNVADGTRLASAIAKAKQVFGQEHYGFMAGDNGENIDAVGLTVASRLRDLTDQILARLHAVTSSPSPENVEIWKGMAAYMVSNREQQAPIFEAYLRSLETRAFLRQKENEQAKLHSKQASKAPQTAYNGTIPPMPTEAQIRALNPPMRLETPATDTGNPLTAFLGGGTAEATALEPAARPQHEQVTSAVKPLEPGEVAAWLANLDKEPGN